MDKIISLALIFTGEFLAVCAEAFGARKFAQSGEKFFSIFWVMLGIMILGGICLVAGYMLGYKAFKNIWIVTAISITAILIVEPAINYSLFHELPTKGALSGLVLGIVGIGLTLFVK